jgi:predicted GNAT family acetyltransferase
MSTLAFNLNTNSPAIIKDGASVSATPGFSVTSLSPDEEVHVLSLLTPDSLTNVIMAGFIRDNGFSNPLNRGQFYGCRDEKGTLEGVALIGHTVLVHALSSNALKAFAEIARRESPKNLLMAERQVGEEFWKYYAENDAQPRLVCPIVFLRAPIVRNGGPTDSGLRVATPDELHHLMDVHAQIVRETSNINPLQKDPNGFRERYLRRIEKKRVWVLFREGKLIFKADVLAESPDATYIEGVYVRPDERGKGIGRQCMAALGKALQDRTKAIYLFVENKQTRSMSFYLNLGFEAGGQYNLLYF